jgi:hypothetical protein
MPNPNRVVDGDAQFRRGMNSVNPMDLPDGFYFRAFNLINRGGVLQTRPGYKWVATLPAGVLQGFTIFKPKGAASVLVAVVGGLVYKSIFPYSTFEQVEGIRLYSEAPAVYFAHTTKSVQRNADGSLSFIVPRNVLMISDNTSAPAYFDGVAAGHITGPKTTPTGGPMAWSGDRLWIAVGNQIYASDISDPFSFYEDTYNTLGGRQYFTVEGNVTAMSETPGLDSPQLLVFTSSQTIMFRSSIRERSLWVGTNDFQRTLFTNIGCVAHRSLVAQNGLLYWMSAYGLISFDAAVLSIQSSQLPFQDNEMAFSKARLNGNLSGVAGASFENFLLMSVPYAHNDNTHTWVLDYAVQNTLNDRQPPAWVSVWTGIQPVEWSAASVEGEPRIFCASRDADGSNRVWEAFDYRRRDEGCDIEWLIETRAYTNKNITLKEFRYAELRFSDLRGQVDLDVAWAGATKGRWRSIATSRILANEGTIDATENLGPLIFALKKQARIYRTQDVRDVPPGELTACGIESDFTDHQDVGFQLCIRGSGQGAIHSIRVYMDEVIENPDGKCNADETVDNFVRIDGAGSHDLTELETEIETEYSASASATASYGGITVSATASATSTISQAAADKLAHQRAHAIVNAKLVYAAPPFVGGGAGLAVDPLDWRLDFSLEGNSGYVPLLV